MAAILVLLSALAACVLAASVNAGIKCHVCNSTSPADRTCTDTHLGEQVDACASCVSYKLDDKRFTRECRSEYKDDVCEVIQSGPRIGQVLCVCNTALCNADIVFRPFIRCIVCAASSDTDTHCTDNDLQHVADNCLTCRVSKGAQGKFNRTCLSRYRPDFCWLNDGDDQFCRCSTDLCNRENLLQPTMQCYYCVPASDTDRKCTAPKSGRIVDGCLSCSTSVYLDGITTRHCKYYVVRDTSSFMEYGSNITECGTGLCNGGEDEEDVNRNRGSRKTVEGRVLIGGVVAAVLDLVRRFSDVE